MFTALTPIEEIKYAKLLVLTRQSHQQRLLGLQAFAKAKIARYEMQKVESNRAFPKLNARLQDIMVYPFLKDRSNAIDIAQQRTMVEREKQVVIIQIRKEIFN